MQFYQLLKVAGDRWGVAEDSVKHEVLEEPAVEISNPFRVGHIKIFGFVSKVRD
jgi:hypothetical protein